MLCGAVQRVAWRKNGPSDFCRDQLGHSSRVCVSSCVKNGEYPFQGGQDRFADVNTTGLPMLRSKPPPPLPTKPPLPLPAHRPLPLPINPPLPLRTEPLMQLPTKPPPQSPLKNVARIIYAFHPQRSLSQQVAPRSRSLSRGRGRLVPAEQRCRAFAFSRHVADVR